MSIMNTLIRKTIYDWIIEIFSFLCLLGCCYPLLFYGKLDGKKIPIHYNVSGIIDGWGDRSFLFSLPIVALAFYLVFFILERNYKRFNYPVEVTKENSAEVYRLGVKMIRHVKVFLMFVFAYISITTLCIAMDNGKRLSGMVMTVWGVALILTIVYDWVKIYCLRE